MYQILFISQQFQMWRQCTTKQSVIYLRLQAIELSTRGEFEPVTISERNQH